MRRTPLHDAHVAARAKLVEFAGWAMPLQYSGVVDEYDAVRKAAGLFDVSHMGRIAVEGEEALPFLQHTTTNDVTALEPGHSHYSMVCNPQGGIKDDVYVYRLRSHEFLLCVNASNREKIAGWLREHATAFPRVRVRDQSDQVAQLALQGPCSRAILQAARLAAAGSLKPRHCAEATFDGASLWITRTGYTGELGYELYLPSDKAPHLWEQLLAVGRPLGGKPAGLGARDLLRLEMGYLLYGNDISEETTPLEAGVGWVVAFQKGAFIGRERLAAEKESGPARRLVAFELLEKAVPRHGYPVVAHAPAQTKLGVVTSGNLSPLLQKGIGLAYVPPGYASAGSSFAIDIRGRLVPAKVVTAPFYRKKT